jgi:hypothetical protein
VGGETKLEPRQSTSFQGGETKLDPGQSTSIQAAPGEIKIWGRTGCNFDDNGQGSCTTGDCDGVLACKAAGKPPATLAELNLGGGIIWDFYDISLEDGFNVPMSLTPGSGSCHTITCSADINAQCPSELKVDGGCVSPCIKFNTPDYCCTPPKNTSTTCPPTDYSRFFKGLCPDAISYRYDYNNSGFVCGPVAEYQVTFCP